jgi:FkbM family methyltransferase
VEAIPELYEELERSIAGYPKQRAVKALATDKDGDSHVIHVASNHGASSSILELHQHRDIWPDIEFVRDIELESSTLPTALSRVGLDPSHYDALIVDTQGSELMVLRGAEPLFPHLTHIQVEAADFEPYKGCATVAGLCTFLSARGFRLVRKKKTATHPDGGRYFDLLFRNSACLRY